MLDRRHDLELMQVDVPGMRGAIRGPCGPEDIGDLKRGTHRSAVRGLLVRRGQRKPVERTDD